MEGGQAKGIAAKEDWWDSCVWRRGWRGERGKSVMTAVDETLVMARSGEELCEAISR